MEALVSAIVMQVLVNTPWWVFALFFLLLALGLVALRPRVVPLWRLLVTPAVFIGWGLVSLMLRFTPLLAFDWVVAAAVGGLLARATVSAAEIRVKAEGIAVSGSALPLVRSMLIFFAKYGLSVAAVLVPAQQHNIAIWDIAVSGVSAGYFLGWLAILGLVYRRATRPALIEQSE
jgi:hypothetical protein